MQASWATSGLDLHLELAGSRSRRGLEHALRQAITDGRLLPGTRLPASRPLAADLGLARNTVAGAYAQLVAEGWLVARQGSGTRVAERPAGPRAAGQAAAPAAAAAGRSWRYDLRPGRPDLSSFPRREWLAAAGRALRRAPSAALGYGDPRGTAELREALAGYLARARGVRADPSRILVCSGFTQALGLAGQALASLGITSAVIESHGLPASRHILTAAGLSVRTMTVDAEGADPAAAGEAGAAVLTPAHQFPLGVVLSPRRRARALAWARDTGGVLIEDDYDGEFRYDRDPVGALQGLDPERVVYAGTASKTLAPGIRLAWLVLPAWLTGPAAAAKRLADQHSEVLGQLTLAELIGSGGYDRHIRRRRLAYRRRRDHLLATIARHAPGCRAEGISAGLHALVRLPEGVTEQETVAAAAARGLGLEGLGAYQAGTEQQPPALVVGYATPPDHAFSTALARLRATLREIS